MPDPRRTVDLASFEEAQRTADLEFARYRVAQLLTAGGTPRAMAEAVLREIVADAGAAAAAVWLAEPDDDAPVLLALVRGDDPSLPRPDVPASFPGIGAAGRWAAATGWAATALEELRDAGPGAGAHAIGFLAVAPAPGRPVHGGLDALVDRVGPELAIGLSAARQLEAYDADRAALEQIVGLLVGRLVDRGTPAAPPSGRLEAPGLGLVVDTAHHRVAIDGLDVHLTPTEFRLLATLVERPGALVGHDELILAAWGPGYGHETHLLQATVRNLRAKLAAAAPDRRVISTVYGLGYRLAD